MGCYKCPKCGAVDSIVVITKEVLDVDEDGVFNLYRSGDVVEEERVCDSCGARFGWEDSDSDRWSGVLVPLPASFGSRSKQGYPIIYRGYDAPVLFREGHEEPYVVAFGYDDSRGDWSQGFYTGCLSAAVNRADNG